MLRNATQENRWCCGEHSRHFLQKYMGKNEYMLTNTEQRARVKYLKVLSDMRRSTQATPAFPILITSDNHKENPSTLQ